MKINSPVTGVEVDYSSNANILSTTDPKGAITYINQDFIDISGFSEEELINMNHNVVRHPEMPAAAFDDLWNNLKGGQPWMGMVKNRCKNGDHYWVDAFVTPITENGSTVEYQSVRTKPTRERVERAEKCYQKLNEGKTTDADKRRLSFKHQLFIGQIIASLPILGLALFNGISTMMAMAIYLLTLMIGYAAIAYIMRPFDKLVKDAREVVQNGLMQYIYTGRSDEIGEIRLAIKLLRSKLGAVTGRMSDTADNLVVSTNKSTQSLEETRQSIKRQQSEIDQVATAMNEMSATVSAVAQNTTMASEVAQKGNDDAMAGQQIVSQVRKSTNELANEVEIAAEVIERVSIASENIGSIVDVINGIAEQTNLLALNAAIEAARAGEQGRGFAVVADEVRSLASRTQQSTLEIQKMVEQLQSGTSEAVQAMNKGRSQANHSVEQTDRAKQMLDTIMEGISTIKDMSMQIASASEQQSAMTAEVNNNIANISTMSKETIEGAETTAKISQELIENTDMCLRLTNHFRNTNH